MVLCSFIWGRFRPWVLIGVLVELCRKAFSGDDFTQEELEEELAPVLVQQGLVHQLLGQTDEALNLYTAALKSKYTSLHSYSCIRAMADMLLGLRMM